jgi:hypothetical protein
MIPTGCRVIFESFAKASTNAAQSIAAQSIREPLTVWTIRAMRKAAGIIAVVAALSLAACNGREQRVESDSAMPAEAVDQAIDPVRALALTRYFTEDGFRSVGGACIKTDPEPGRSRIVYALLPSELTYVRLNVVSLDGRRVDMIELVRGVTGGGGARIWTAITHARNGRLGPIVTEPVRVLHRQSAGDR